MIRSIYAVVVFLMFSFCTIAQNDDEYKPAPIPEQEVEEQQVEEEEEEFVPFEEKKLFEYTFVGGNANFFLSSRGLQLGISPAYGVGLTKNLRIGAGPSIQYFSIDNAVGDNDQFTLVGGRIFGQYHIVSGIFAAVEYDKEFEFASVQNTQIRREFNARGKVGFGYNTKGDFETEGVEFSVELLYDVLHDNDVDPRTPLEYKASIYFTF